MKENYEALIKQTSEKLNINFNKVKKIVNGHFDNLGDLLNKLPYADIRIPKFCVFRLRIRRLNMAFEKGNPTGARIIKKLNKNRAKEDWYLFDDNPIIKEYIEDMNQKIGHITNFKFDKPNRFNNC
jgi:nucleoid DNA-binding protein